MSLRLDHDDPEAMSPAERRDEVASILARGTLRLRGRIAGDFDEPGNLAESAPTCLDLCATSRRDPPHPSVGVHGSEMQRCPKPERSDAWR
ncbi:MAG: hypothetical protein KF817_02105 [Phycisphaeraceae bacterium]|nr:hypothetical protein [Phycisphaeraceae bacterium]